MTNKMQLTNLKIVMLAASGLIFSSSGVNAEKFRLPVDCHLGVECFIQNYPDMAEGEEVADPFCGKASYDTHKGLDIRLRSLVDMEQNVPVLAVDDGVVLRYRDGEPDVLVKTEAQLAAVAKKECGNALVIKHTGGIEVQYCHMKQASVAVRPGVKVKAGQKIGEVGSSGKSEIPHLHIHVTLNGELVDPVTGRLFSDGCQPGEPEPQSSLFSAEFLPHMSGQSALLDSGISDQKPNFDRLVIDGPPPTAKPGSSAIFGWVWFVNVRKGDRVRIIILRPDGSTLIDETGEPLPKDWGAYAQFAGHRQPPVPGDYIISYELIRDGNDVASGTRRVHVGE